MVSLSKRQLCGLSKPIFPILKTLALTATLLWGAPAVAAPLPSAESQERATLNERLRDISVASPLPSIDRSILISAPPERDLLERLEAMENSPGARTWVEQAPKAWPFPMVISPGRPVLPGSVW